MCLRSFSARGAPPSGAIFNRPFPSILPAACLRATQRIIRIRGLARSCRHGAAPVSRAKRLQVVAFRDATEHTAASNPPPARNMSVSEHVSIAIDYYRLLQVPRVSPPDAVRKGYEALVKQHPATAYSADTLFARAVLLKAAAESLIDPDLRSSYDAKLAAGYGALRVSQQDLPGALVVLQEIGEFQLALDHGSRWLDLNGSQPDAGDVAAVVALAFCDRAGERLAAPANNGAVLPACDDLDAALVKLRRYGVAKQLQTQIVGALRDLAPEYACELAALQLDTETSVRRAKGVALMRGVLRSAASVVARGAGSSSGAIEVDGGDLLGGDDDAHSVVGHARRMLQRGRDVLTCSEQVSLLPDALLGSGVMPHPDVLYDGALACLVDGYRNGWPHSVRQADQLLAQLEEQVQRHAAAQREKEDLAAAAAARRVHYNGAAAAAESPGVYHYDDVAAGGGGGGEGSHTTGSVALERAVCAVLLGDYEAAAARLGLAGGGAGAGPAAAAADAQLRSFVMEHAPSGSQDMRPGMRALATKWLGGVALASFRDTAGQAAMPLETSWFADPRVGTYLQVYRVSRNEHVLAAAHFLCNLLPSLIKILTAFALKAATAAALAASRGQRIAGALAAAAAAGAASTQRESPGASSPPLRRGAPPSGTGRPNESSSRRLPGSGITSGDGIAAGVPSPPPAAAAAATASPVEAAVSVGAAEPSTAGAGRSRPATTPNPFGHPYGQTLRSIAEPTAATMPVPEVSASPTARARNAIATRTFPSHDMDTVQSAAAAGIGAAAASSAPDFRRRFAASAAFDADGGAGPRAAGLDGDDEDEHQGDGTALAEDELDLDDTLTPAPRRGMTEQDLRAHLAGLEAAMWDSEVPGSGPSPQRLVMMAAGAIAMLAALFFLVLRRNDGGVVAARAPAMHPAVVSITVSAFVSPN